MTAAAPQSSAAGAIRCPDPRQLWQGTFWNMPSPGQVAHPRPQHSDISTLPAPWQAGHGGTVTGASAASDIGLRAYQTAQYYLPTVPRKKPANPMDLKPHIAAVADFPKPGILFRDIMPLLRTHFAPAIEALDALLTEAEWRNIDAVVGIESRGFILGAALALRRGKGFIPVRKQGKLPPPVSQLAYSLEYGTATLEMQSGHGNVVLVDDVLATGGTLRAAAALCTRSGFQLQGLLALVDLKLVPSLVCEGHAVRAAVTYG